MRRTTSLPRAAGTAAAIVATVAVAVTAALAFGWPPAEASAKLVPEDKALFGVVKATAVDLGPAVTAQSKFAEAVTDSLQSSVATLAAPAVKRRAPVVKPPKPAPERTAKPAPAVKKPAKKAKKSVKAKSKSGWRSARVSWYGPGLYGNGMAGGGRLKRNSMVVAHRTLKFGTKIEFRYKGRTVTAVVRDRGPFIRGRVFDLGPGTAKTLRFDGVGTVKYRIVR